MAREQDITKESSSVIKEIESQLDKLLARKKEDVEQSLVGRIQQERDSARKKIEETEREFEKEREALSEYRLALQEAETERIDILAEIRERSKKILHLQAEVESLTKSTVEEVRRMTDLHRTLEELRQKTAEKAGFLKKDLRERFGIIADMQEGRAGQDAKPDLDQELEKLRRIRELLSAESVQREGPGLFQEPGPGVAEPPLPEAEEASLRIPDIPELIESETSPEEDRPAEAPSPGTFIPGVGGPVSEGERSSGLEAYRKSEPANGSGEIHYFQKGKKIILDGELLIAAIERTLEEARKLTLKLSLAESPKDQFFIKQEIINWQEGLRRFVLRIARMGEKKACSFPAYTADILNFQTLKGILERLSAENWSKPIEFQAFDGDMKALRNAFLARVEPAEKYRKAVREEIESD